MDFVEYGNTNSRLVVYFHGAPGGIEESSLFEKYARKNNLKFVCLDRFAIDAALKGASYYQSMAQQIELIAGGKSLDIIGFSLGAYVAIEVSRLLQDQVRQLHLVSAVAPLDSGDFIDHMAGGLVFKLAREKPFIFKLVTHVQRFMATIAPKLFVKLLFANSVGKDRTLIKRADFKQYITSIIKHCFQNRGSGYARDINLYSNWLGHSVTVCEPVSLWHGTDDNWTLFAMASSLHKLMPNSLSITSMEGLSYYSCLHEAAPRICAQLGKT